MERVLGEKRMNLLASFSSLLIKSLVKIPCDLLPQVAGLETVYCKLNHI